MNTMGCVGCRKPHTYEVCLQNPQSVCFIQNNRYSNTYNPDRRNDPNLSWGGNNQPKQQSAPMHNKDGSSGFHQGYQKQNQPQQSTPSPLSSIEALLKEYMQKNDVQIQTQASSIRNLELPLGQIAGELKTRQKGSFPSTTEAPHCAGSSGKEQCKL